MPRLFDYLNSSIAVAILGPAVLGIAATAFKLVVDHTTRIQDLDERLARLSTEYEGRLSQYSEWLIYLTEKPGQARPIFRKCVDADLLRRSIKEFAAKPTQEPVKQYLSNVACKEPFKFNAMFTDLSNESTLGLVSEMRVIQQELERRGKGRRSVTKVVGCEAHDLSLTERLTKAANALLHPDAVVPFALQDSADSKVGKLTAVEALRGPFMCSFYGIGPERLWYTDIPWG